MRVREGSLTDFRDPYTVFRGNSSHLHLKRPKYGRKRLFFGDFRLFWGQIRQYLGKIKQIQGVAKQIPHVWGPTCRSNRPTDPLGVWLAIRIWAGTQFQVLNKEDPSAENFVGSAHMARAAGQVFFIGAWKLKT